MIYFEDVLHEAIVDSSIDLKIKFIGLINDMDYPTYRFVFYQNYNIVGEMTIENYGKIINIDNFWINKNYRNLRFGNKILNYICKELSLLDYLITLMAMPLDNNISLEKLIEFYNQIGFKQIGSIIEGTAYMEYEK